jgi:hypothetical protein
VIFSPPVSVWLATAFAGSILVWGYSQVSDLIRHGDINLFHALLTLGVFYVGLIGFLAMRWWGLVLAACGAIHVAVFSAISGQLGTIATMVVFFAPLAVIASVNRSQFRWRIP